VQRERLLVSLPLFSEVLIADPLAASKVTMLQTWISSPNWSGPFERARGRRLDDTGMWILENEQYKDWKVQPINADLHWARNILIITGIYIAP